MDKYVDLLINNTYTYSPTSSSVDFNSEANASELLKDLEEMFPLLTG